MATKAFILALRLRNQTRQGSFTTKESAFGESEFMICDWWLDYSLYWNQGSEMHCQNDDKPKLWTQRIHNPKKSQHSDSIQLPWKRHATELLKIRAVCLSQGLYILTTRIGWVFCHLPVGVSLKGEWNADCDVDVHKPWSEVIPNSCHWSTRCRVWPGDAHEITHSHVASWGWQEDHI